MNKFICQHIVLGIYGTFKWRLPLGRSLGKHTSNQMDYRQRFSSPFGEQGLCQLGPRAKDTGTLGIPTAQTLALSVPLNIYVITSRAYSVPCPKVVPFLSHSQVHSFVPLQDRQPELLFGRLSLNTAPETLSQNYVSSSRMLEPCFHTAQTEN